MPLLVPSRPWESISMDYQMGYPTSEHQHDMILVVVNIFSKMAILIPCKKTTKHNIIISYSLNMCGNIMASRRPLFSTKMLDLLAPFGKFSENNSTQDFSCRKPSIHREMDMRKL